MSLKIQNLKVNINSTSIIKDISLDIPFNSVVSIIGKNGSGKTTTLKSLVNLIDSEGSIYIDDINIKNLSIKERAKYIAYLPQNREIPSISGRLMIEHGRFPYLGFGKVLNENDNKIIKEAINKTHVENLLNKKLTEMSGGELQKIYITSTIAQNSNFVLLDEPTNHLDLSSQIELLELIRNLKNDEKSFIIVQHNIVQAFTYSDYIIVLDEGKIILQGKPDEIYNSNIIKEIFNYSLEKEENPNSVYSYKITK